MASKIAHQRRKSSSRLSNIFSSSAANLTIPSIDEQAPAPTGPHSAVEPSRGSNSPPRGRTAPNKLSKERVPSGQLQDPVPYPSPSPGRPELSRKPTINHVQTDFPDGLLPPPPMSALSPGSGSPRNGSPDSRIGSRPVTPVLSVPPGQYESTTLTPTKESKLRRKSWFGSGHKSRDSADDGRGPLAWVVGHQGKLPYNLSLLLGAERVPELWDPNGDVFVYLFPRTSSKGPSFRIDGSYFSASPALTRLAYGNIYSGSAQTASTATVKRKSLEPNTRNFSGPASNASTSSAPSTPPLSPRTGPFDGSHSSSTSSKTSRVLSDADSVPSETHLYIPLSLSTDGALPTPNRGEPRHSAEDVETLVAIRNLFGFLMGQSLVATERRPSVFSVFMKIAELLQAYEFSNQDGSTYGEVAASSFDSYVEELQIADVRTSREKTIEGIVLGERMRSSLLFNEAYVHGVGKYDAITRMNSPKFPLISSVTRNRMERQSMDLELRCKNITQKLNDFDFPAIFSGIMSSKTADEGKVVRFPAWKAAFLGMRKHVLSYYKHKYGSWPPKASSKKNNFEESGLNRLVVKDLYHDFAMLYDLLVDRQALTTRSADAPPAEDSRIEPHTAALRRVLDEYDRSTPPVQPAVPFDVPVQPTLATIRPEYGRDPKADAKLRSKKLKGEEVFKMLHTTYNKDSNIKMPFLDAFREFEHKSAHGCTYDEVLDLRMGQWIFMYAVLESLPLLGVDAPGVKWTHGVEYFLCEVPLAGVPWARGEGGTKRAWYGVAGSSGVVALPADVVEHGVEGVYRRSHCWRMAEKWTQHSEVLHAAVTEQINDRPLPPPPGPGAMLQAPSSRGSSPRRSNRESVMMLGLEALPLPQGVAPASPVARPASANDPSKTFDAILANPEIAKHQKSDKKKK